MSNYLSDFLPKLSLNEWVLLSMSFLLLLLVLIFSSVHLSYAEPAGQQFFVSNIPFETVSVKDSPFRGVEAILKRLRRKEYVVSAAVFSNKGAQLPPSRLEMNAIHWVPVYADQAFDAIKEFAFLSSMKPYVVEQKWNRKNRSLYIHGEAFSYHAQMWMDVYYTQHIADGNIEKKTYEIHWRHTRGLFKGMTGVVVVEDVGRRMSQISMTTRYNFEKLPLPDLFIQFGLEIILKKVAFHVHKYILKKS